MGMHFKCDDGNAEIEVGADSAQEAAEEYVSDGDWGEIEKTTWINVYVQEVGEEGGNVGERERCKVALHPKVPNCFDRDAHDWQAPHHLVGGLQENPGVSGHGGGVTITEACTRCGCKRITDTWAQDPETGEQGLESVSYERNAFEVNASSDETEVAEGAWCPHCGRGDSQHDAGYSCSE